ncbi:MAG: GTP 3',8-cyclase MoaA [Nannocystaceae bacterium]
MQQLTQLRLEPRDANAARASAVAVLEDGFARRVRYLRLSVTDRCNYRCTYCMPEDVEQVRRQDLLSFEEWVELVQAFVGWGVERVRITGGEPTVRKGLCTLVERLTALPTPEGRLSVAMTTNGETMAELGASLFAAGLRDVTVSIDSLQTQRFRRVTRRGNLGRVRRGLDKLGVLGFRGVKLNIVAIRGFNDDELVELAMFAWERRFTPRFIELMPMAEGELFVPGELMTAKDIRDRIALELGANLEPDDGDGVRGLGPARYWRVTGGRYAGRRLGTIGAMTENFCAACNRLRISASGQIQGCLAHDDAGDLRAALRVGAGTGSVEAVVRSVLAGKREAHSFSLDGTGGPNKAMVTIGG